MKPAHTTEFQVRMPIDADGRLTRDTECLSCGYNLRGALESGDCPECGSEVADALLGARLREMPLDWIPKLVDGLDILIGSYIMMPVVLPFAMVSAAMGAARLLDPNAAWRPSRSRRARNMALWLMAGCFAIVAVNLALYAFCTPLWSLPAFTSPQGRAGDVLHAWMWMLPTGLFLIGLGLTGVYCTHVAQALGWRALANRLRRSARTLIWGGGIATFACALCILPLGPLVIAVLSIAVVVSVIVHVSQLLVLRTRLRNLLAARDRAPDRAWYER